MRIKTRVKVTKELRLKGAKEEKSLENSPEKYTRQEKRKLEVISNWRKISHRRKESSLFIGVGKQPVKKWSYEDGEKMLTNARTKFQRHQK